MDLRDVVHRCDTAVDLAQASEQLVDVDVLRPVHGSEFAEDELEVVDRTVRLAVVEQQPVGKEAAQRRLELVMVRIDEAGHDDAPARVDHSGAGGAEVGSDVDDLLALDQHVRLGEIAHLRVHRHHVAAPNDVASSRPAVVSEAVIVVLRRSRTVAEQGQSRGGRPGGGRGFQEIATRLPRDMEWSCGLPSSHILHMVRLLFEPGGSHCRSVFVETMGQNAD